MLSDEMDLADSGPTESRQPGRSQRDDPTALIALTELLL
jgi:hypothetical protein